MIADQPQLSVPSLSAQCLVLVFDLASVQERLDGDNELVRVVLEAFLDDIPCQIQALKEHLANGDSSAAGRVAHAIRGASANVGGDRLRNLAKEMEMAANNQDLNIIKTRMPELEAAFVTLRKAIESTT